MTKFQALIMTPDGDISTVQWVPSTADPNYAHLQAYVGGLATVVPLASDLDIWVSDNADELGLEKNYPASVIAAFVKGRKPRKPFAGIVAFTGGSDANGEVLPLPDATADLIKQVVSEMKALFA